MQIVHILRITAVRKTCIKVIELIQGQMGVRQKRMTRKHFGEGAIHNRSLVGRTVNGPFYDKGHACYVVEFELIFILVLVIIRRAGQQQGASKYGNGLFEFH